MLSQEKTDTQVNGELNFKCKVCNRCYKGVAAFRIHSLDVHSIEDPELGELLIPKKKKNSILKLLFFIQIFMELFSN